MSIIVETAKPHFIILLLVWSEEQMRTLARAAPGISKQTDFDFFNFFHTSSSESISNFPQLHATPIIYFFSYIYTSIRRSQMTPYENWFSALSLRYIYINYNIIHTAYKYICREQSRRTTTGFKYIHKYALHHRLQIASTICCSLFVIFFDFRGRRGNRWLQQNRWPWKTCAL